jgi:putative transposase
VRHYRYGAHTKTDLKVHLVWIPKYRKKVLVGPVAIRVRDLIRQIAMEHELHIISGKVARDHVHVFLSHRAHQDISTIVQWLKGISSRVLLQEFDEMVKQYIDDQEGEPVHDDSQFPIDNP